MSKIKRNTTPTLPIKIKTSPDSIKSIEFMFGDSDTEYARIYLHKKLEGNIPIDKISDSEFIVNLELAADETLRLPVGDVYIDTRIELNDGKVPPTKIAKVENINSFFRGTS